jgi:hypothetical protein
MLHSGIRGPIFPEVEAAVRFLVQRALYSEKSMVCRCFSETIMRDYRTSLSERTLGENFSPEALEVFTLNNNFRLRP